MNAIRLLSALLSGVAVVASIAGEAEVETFEFAHDVAPILAKAGCSAAECHGGASGKGGFKLSLFSSDPRSDFEAITREFGARRVDFVAPEKSLLLRKPSRQLKHGGGRVLKQNDPAFEKLHRWIEGGAPWSSGSGLELTGLRLKRNDDSVSAIAEFRAGDRRWERDVTALAILESTDESVASVDDEGRISPAGAGETWILARYGHLSARTPVLAPYGERSADIGDVSPLDRTWLKRLEQLGLEPAEPAPESVLIRRLYLDLAGRPPSPLEVSRFSSIAEAADQLLRSEAFATAWAGHLGDWFEVPIAERDPRNGREANQSLRRFFRESMGRDASAAEMAREILLNPAAQAAWKRFQDPRDRAEYIGRSMLGMRIGCARCHNHPLDRWKQAEHLRFSAFFSDNRPNPEGGPMMAGKFFEPETGKPVEPALLPLREGSPPADRSRMEQLAWFVLESGHDQFARNLANRTFGVLIGKPLVDAPEDHRLSNPAIHEALLDHLANTLIDSDYDLRALVREIVTSKLYALSSDPGSPAEQKYIARRVSRRLSSDQYRRAIAFVTGVPLSHPLPPESPLAEQLYVINSGLIQKSLSTPGNQIDALFDFGTDPEEILEDLYLTILSRPINSNEKQIFLPELENAKNLRSRGKDLAFALLASREFGSIR